MNQVYKFKAKEVDMLRRYYIEKEGLHQHEAQQMVKQVIISNEMIRKSRKKAGQAREVVFGSMFIVGLISLLVAVSAIESDWATLTQGFFWGLGSLGFMFLAAVGLGGVK